MKKSNIITTCLIIVALIIQTGSFAQKNVEFDKANFPTQKDQLKEALKNIKEGDRYYLLGESMYTTALDYFLKANAFNSNNALLNYKLGVCYINGNKKLMAKDFLEKAYALDPDVNPEIHYLLGGVYQLEMSYDKAIVEYKTYIKSLPQNKYATEKPKAEKRIKECNTGKELVANPARVIIDNLGGVVNSEFSEYSPVISADESVMMFTSRRPNTTGGNKDEGDFNWYEDIYISYNEKGKWSPPVNPGKPLNTEIHDAVNGLSNDGQLLFTYKGDNGGDLFFSKLEGENWSKPERLNKNINTEYHEPGATLSPDGRTLYFVSNKEGGRGGHDIYYSVKNEKGKWGDAFPVNELNSEYDEDCIFMHPDGKTMYFSSKGHKTMGGYDIFKSVLENGKWSEPENMGYPINTTDNDVFFVISASGKHGYYSSAKDGGLGSQDIYLIKFLGAEKPVVNNTEDNLIASIAEPVSETVIAATVDIQTTALTILKGVVTDEQTKLPVLASIELTDNEKNEVIATFESNSKTGKYLVSLPAGKNYGIAVKGDGYLFHSENFEIPKASGYQEIVKDVELKKMEVGKKIVLRNIFFDFNKSTLRPESTAELDRLAQLLVENPKLKIEISGHTDSKGTDEYNRELSERRAKAVVDYLIKNKNIPSSRLEYKGYGESQAIATNETDEGRQLNRRTEFKILSN
ncbi:MAG: OmpA family protein [Bacteroidetes bacterium]|nr:OmpA family protein [Bacteroidota bacterium]MBU1719777.1 OmpA family protein [Bacteroidota bacterium]